MTETVTNTAANTVVITGGTAGVGRATARAFAAAGHPVAVLARGADALAATTAELHEFGVPNLGISVDVTDRLAVDRAADEIEAELGPVGVWVNSAMVTVFGPFAEVEPDDFDRVVDVVFGGTVNGTRAALRLMRPRGSGRVVQVGSALAYRGIPLQAAYSSAKHAVQGLSDSLRSELRHDGLNITLSEVNLPAVNTPQFDMCKNLLDAPPQPVPPIYQPEVAAEAILHAARTGERAVNVSWVATRTVLADRVAPGSLDQLLADTGYDSQKAPGRTTYETDNLYEPLPGDHGCHGSFDSDATARSGQERLRHTPVGTVARYAGDAGRWLGARVMRRVL